MQWIALFLIFLVNKADASGFIKSSTQYINLTAQKESGINQELSTQIRLNSKWDAGVRLDYLERFNIFDKRGGTLVSYRPNDQWKIEASYLQGNGNKILPEKDLNLNLYHAFSTGLSPFVFVRNAQYSLTNVNSLSLGTEIEKIPNFIIIPSFMIGEAKFNGGAPSKNIYSLGLRIIYLREKHFSLSVFSYKAQEASQAVLGSSTFLVDTLSAGASFSWYWGPQFKTEIIFDHTNFDELKTQFHTTTLNITRTF